MAKSKEGSGKSGSSEVAVARRESPAGGVARRGLASPFGLLHDMSSEMSRLFNTFPFARDFGGWEGDGGMLVPQVDVLRRGDDLVVRADLPGLSKDDISVDVTDNALTIRGERRDERKEEREGYYLHERSEGSFYRSIPLPDGTDLDSADARFENGVLEVRMRAPQDETKKGRRIEIR